MKKLSKFLPLIIGITLILGLSLYCYSLYTKQDSLSKEHSKLTSDMGEIQSELDEKDSYIEGQSEYIKELTEQISVSQDESTEEPDVKSNNTKSNKEDKYPNLYASENKASTENNKTVYLTFDDGPSSRTDKVLDLLDEYNAKATFFVIHNEKDAQYLKEIVDRGHTLALHSYSHDYNKIYASVDAFLDDFNKLYEWVYEETGEKCTLFRFPGGSVNKNNQAVINKIIAEMQRRGFIYYDWNVSSGDGSNLTATENIIDNVCNNVNSFNMPVVLLHDTDSKDATFEALPTLLKNLSDDGYSFNSLTPRLKPVQY